ncbi:hypothetical protein FACS1894158_07060 [Betaproteobacteria bacterium]|nr:hypothetical protein FACS1894158_07060 [Betaproteobacteria bacterium]
MGVLLTLTESANAGPGGMFYCCTDASGKYVCGDILPQSCYGRGYRELGADGRTLREVAPPMTAEQRAQRSADEEAQRREAEAQREQQIKDKALLETYANVDDLESLRKRALDDVQKFISNAEAQIADIKARRKKFEDEAEFYKTKTLPLEIEKGLSGTETDIKAQESAIAARKKEIAAIQAKYDEDRRRLIELQRQGKPK